MIRKNKMKARARFELQFLTELHRLGKSRPLKEVNAEAGVGMYLTVKDRLEWLREMHRGEVIVLKKTKRGEWWVRPTKKGRQALRALTA